jgi:hypothetical protein
MARRARHLTQPDGTVLRVLSLKTYRVNFAMHFLHLAGVEPTSFVKREALRLRARGVKWRDAATELAGEYLAANLPPEVR